jgi:hypothetical protein
MFLIGAADTATYVKAEAMGKKPRKEREWKYETDDEELFGEGVEVGD